MMFINFDIARPRQWFILMYTSCLTVWLNEYVMFFYVTKQIITMKQPISEQHLWVTLIEALLKQCISRTLKGYETVSATHIHPFNGPFLGLPGLVGTRKVKPIWILQKQETVSGSGISWAICKSAPRSRQITMPAPHHSVFYRPDALPAAQPTVSKHWRHWNRISYCNIIKFSTSAAHNLLRIWLESLFVPICFRACSREFTEKTTKNPSMVRRWKIMAVQNIYDKCSKTTPANSYLLWRERKKKRKKMWKRPTLKIKKSGNGQCQGNSGPALFNVYFSHEPG